MKCQRCKDNKPAAEFGIHHLTKKRKVTCLECDELYRAAAAKRQLAPKRAFTVSADLPAWMAANPRIPAHALFAAMVGA